MWHYSLHSSLQFPNPNPPLPLFHHFSNQHTHLIIYPPLKFSCRRNFTVHSPAKLTSADEPVSCLQVAAASAVLFFGLSACVFSATAAPLLPTTADTDRRTSPEEKLDDGVNGSFEDEKLNTEFELWKSKAYPLSVPLRVVALRGSIPPSWVKDFMQSQGKRLRFHSKFLGSLDNIFSDLSVPSGKRNIGPTSVVATDIVTIGDSWLSFAIKKSLIEPIRGAEDQDWFKALSDKWKAYLCRNRAGEIDSKGEIWAAPYRWGSMVIAYKKSKFQKHKLAPIEDWADLWRPELAGKISMIDSPREVLGAVLKYMGASYNTQNINVEVAGGKCAVEQSLALLGKQVRLFDSTNYLRAFGVGDVWVAVGWSSDVIPVAKRISNVAVIVPKSGSSLWADLWAIPAASRFEKHQIGSRVKGPSPLIHQWIEFCLQDARALPFKQEVIPGAIPSSLESTSVALPRELTGREPRLDTNLIAGVPPPDILSRCEFLEPLSDAALSDYKLLISSMEKHCPGLIHRVQNNILSTIQTCWLRLKSNAT